MTQDFQTEQLITCNCSQTIIENTAVSSVLVDDPSASYSRQATSQNTDLLTQDSPTIIENAAVSIVLVVDPSLSKTSKAISQNTDLLTRDRPTIIDNTAVPSVLVNDPSASNTSQAISQNTDHSSAITSSHVNLQVTADLSTLDIKSEDSFQSFSFSS